MNIGCLAGLPALVSGPPGSPGLPLVEAVHRDDAAGLAEHALERRLLGDRLGAGVDHLRRRSCAPWPTPGSSPQWKTSSRGVAVGTGDDGVDVVRRGDVEVLAERLAVERGAEVLGDLVGRAGGDEATAHGADASRGAHAARRHPVGAGEPSCGSPRDSGQDRRDLVVLVDAVLRRSGRHPGVRQRRGWPSPTPSALVLLTTSAWRSHGIGVDVQHIEVDVVERVARRVVARVECARPPCRRRSLPAPRSSCPRRR